MELTSRTQVKRLAKRARYDEETIYGILDEGIVCHVGFVQDGGPIVIPTGYARSGMSHDFPWKTASASWW